MNSGIITEERRTTRLLPNHSDNPDDWDSYHTLVDDCPASIALDFAVGEHAPLAERPGLLAVLIHMNEPGEHGMGEGVDPEALRHVEQQIVYAFEAKLDALFVGRVRSQGVWQLYFYTIESEEIEVKATELLSGFSGWQQDIHVRTDPEWEMYFELLFPDRERLQWMRNRRFCEALAAEGDPLVFPRRIDHYAYFATESDRAAFVEAIKADEYEIEKLAFDEEEGDLAYQVQFYRTDNIELDSIHEVTMKLVVLAAKHDGMYDDWETSILVPISEPDSLPN